MSQANQKSMRFLFERIFSAPDEKNLFHRGRIKITSPDQFVPLYLANYGKDAFDTIGALGANSIYKPKPDGTSVATEWMYLPGDKAQSASKLLYSSANLKDKAKKEEFKGIVFPELKKILSAPFPTEYSIVSNRGAGTSNHGVSRTYFLQMFSEFMVQGPMAVNADDGVLVGLGLLMSIHVPYFSSKSTTLYPSLSYNIPLHLLTPEIVVVVKYKYLAIARASLFLRVPMEIPFDGIKLVRTQTIMRTRVAELYNNHIAVSAQQSGMNIEYASTQDMEKYLFPPRIKKTREEYLEDAKRALNEEVPHVIF